MKKLQFYTLLIAGSILLCFSSCDVEDPFPDFQDAPNVRIQVVGEAAINLDDPTSAKIVLDFFSENIDDIASIELTASFFDFSENQTIVEKVPLTMVDPNSFSDGVLRGVEFSFNQIRDALGIQTEDFDALDQVTFFNTTTMNDGRVYPQTFQANQNREITNVTPNILNATATTSFTTSVTAFVQCPVPEDFFTGQYMLEQISGPADPFFGNPTRYGPEVVTVVNTGSINRQFEALYLGAFTATFDMVVTCGTLLVQKGSAGAQCSVGLSLVGDGSVTYTDDEEFIIPIIDNVDADCGLGPAQTTIKLTKL